jgi:hypothetical protein
VTRADRKFRERYLLDAFLRKQGINALVADSESPDFLVSIDGESVGIELTELHHATSSDGVSLQARESVANRIIFEAQKLFSAQGGPSLRVSINFAPTFDPRTIERRSTAEYLCNLLSKITPEQDQISDWRPGVEEYRSGSAAVTYVHVYRHPSHFKPHWLHADAGWVAPITLDLVQRAIQAKAARLHDYRQRVAEVWLLLAVYGRTPSQFFDTEIRFDPSAVRSPFDRTYLHEAFLNHAILLGTPE